MPVAFGYYENLENNVSGANIFFLTVLNDLIFLKQLVVLFPTYWADQAFLEEKE